MKVSSAYMTRLDCCAGIRRILSGICIGVIVPATPQARIASAMSWKMPFKVLGYDVGLRLFMLRMTFPIYFGIKDEDVPDLLLMAFAMLVKRPVSASVDMMK